MAKRIEYKIPTTKGVCTAFGYRVNLYIGRFREQLILQEDNHGNPYILCDYATGCVIQKLDPWPFYRASLSDMRRKAQAWLTARDNHYAESGKDFHDAYKEQVKKAPLGVLNRK